MVKRFPGSILYCQYHTHKEHLYELSGKLCNIEIRPFKCDMRNSREMDAWLQNIESDGVPTHIIHLAADKFEYMRLKNFDTDRFRETLDVQLMSVIRITSRLVHQMAKQKYGRVVFMLTAYTLGAPPKFMSSYITVKYALEGFMKAISSEYSGKGLSINAISPNMMETKFLSNLDPHTTEMAARNSAMKRNISVEETCNAIAFLMSDKAEYINGINRNLSGGDYM